MEHKMLKPRIEKGDILKAIEEMKSKEREAPPKEPQTEENPTISAEPTEINDPENYIILRGREHGSYNYRDLAVSITRLQFSPEVETVAKKLNKVLSNTALTSDGHAYDYIGNINRQEALKLNLILNGRTLNPRQGIDFLLDLREGIEGNKVIEYANNKKAPKKLLERIYDDILGVRNPWRAEFLDADFKVIGKDLHILYDHELKNGILVPQRKEKLEDYLDKKGIKVKLKDFNRQGLATVEQDKGELCFWSPDKDNKSVAGFIADSDRASLYCNRYPDDAFAWLGVRRAKNLGV